MSKSNKMYKNTYTNFDSTPDHEVNSKRVDLEFSLSKAISPIQVCDQIQSLCTSKASPSQCYSCDQVHLSRGAKSWAQVCSLIHEYLTSL